MSRSEKGSHREMKTFQISYRKTEQMLMGLCFQKMTKHRRWDIIQTSPFPCSAASLPKSTQSQRVLQCTTETKQTLSLYALPTIYTHSKCMVCWSFLFLFMVNPLDLELEAVLGSVLGSVNPCVRLRDGDSGRIKIREESEVMLGLKIKD